MLRILKLTLLSLILTSCGDKALKNSEKKEKKANDQADSSLELVVIGDSLANGVFASTHLGQDPALLVNDVLGVFSKVIVGDVSLQSDEMRKEGRDSSRSAFLSNTNGWSIPQQIAHAGSLETIKIIDHALNGAQSSTGFEEVSGMEATKADGARIFLMNRIGNDYCNEKTVEVFKEKYRTVVGQLLETFEMQQLVLFNLAPVQILRNGEFEEKFSFQDIRLKISSADGMRRKYCPSLYKDDYLVRAAQMNAAVDEIVSGFQANNDKIRLIRLDGMGIQREDVAIDGFHLSEKGQRKIADEFAKQWKP